MKLILTQEVTGLGAAGDVVEVKDGYGRNYLIPRGFGIRWTRGGEKTVESIQKSRDARAVRDADHAAEVKSTLEGSTYNVRVRAGEGGRLFGAVTAADIATAIAETGARSTSAPSWWATRSSRSARTPWSSSCTTTSRRRSASTWSLPERLTVSQLLL